MIKQLISFNITKFFEHFMVFIVIARGVLPIWMSNFDSLFLHFVPLKFEKKKKMVRKQNIIKKQLFAKYLISFG
jgi:hypothetical protein